MSKRNLFPTLILAAVLLVVASSTPGMCQGTKKADQNEATTPQTPGIASLIYLDLPRQNHYIRIDLTSPQNEAFESADLAPDNIVIKFLPSGKTLSSTAVINTNRNHPTAPRTEFKTGFGREVLAIGLMDLSGDELKPAPGDDQVEVTFKSFHFASRTDPSENVVGTGKIYNSVNVEQLVEDTREALKDAVAHSKTDDERNAFVGLNINVPSGEGNTEGSGDISFNRTLYAASLGQAAFFDQASFGLNLKKSSENRSDARHFDLGLTFTKTFLIADKAKIRSIREAIRGAGEASDPSTRLSRAQDAMQDIADLQKNFVRALLFDSALRFEGDVSSRGISNVSNLLYDGQLQIATVSRAFAGRTGFWNFRFVPVGVEVGSNLNNNDNQSQERRSLARLKTGGELNLIFKAANPNEALSRVEFSAKALERYLFRSENVLDELTQRVVLTDKGSKYWLQADFKVISGFRTARGRVGFRVSFTRGFLPPVYNFVKSFNFGVIFETNDDDNSGSIKVQ